MEVELNKDGFPKGGVVSEKDYFNHISKVNNSKTQKVVAKPKPIATTSK